MERHFYRRGQRVTVTEMDGILAVQADEIGRGGDAVPKHLGEVAAGIGTDARPSETIASAHESRDMPEQVSDVRAMFQQEDGHVLIGSRTMTVQMAPEMSNQDARTRLAEQGLAIRRDLLFAVNQFAVEVPVGADLLDVANTLQERDDTVFAERTFVEFIGQRLRPSDRTYSLQWHLHNTGDDGGTADADISAEEVWDLARGGGVRLAVIDNGFDVAHPDLAEGIVAESGFFDSSNALRRAVAGFPDSDHGTFCAGMAAARQNKGIDGCGSAPEAELMLIAPLREQTGTQATLARAVACAADPSTEVDDADPATGADVISSSVGPDGVNRALTSVLKTGTIRGKAGTHGAGHADLLGQQQRHQRRHGLRPGGLPSGRHRGGPVATDRQPPQMEGDDVRQWQQRMTVRGHDLVVDGIYGPGSDQLCRALQRSADLTADGIVGPETWKATWSRPVEPTIDAGRAGRR